MALSETTIAREEFEKIVSLVKPAVASQSYIEALTHIYFGEGWAIAYNDVFSIAHKCDLPLGFVPGELLSKALGTLAAETILLHSSDDASLNIAAGRSKLKLPLLSADPSLFDLPKSSNPQVIDVSKDLVRAIDLCLVGVGNDPTHPAQMGVTLSGGNPACVYSTDNYTVSRYELQAHLKLRADIPLLLPTEFCRQLITLVGAYPDTPVKMLVQPSAVFAEIGDVVVLASKLIEDVSPLDFDKIFESNRTWDTYDIPPPLDAAITRAGLILSGEIEKTTQFSVLSSRLKLFSKSKMGEAADTLALKEAENVDTFFIDPTKISRVLKYCTKISFRENSLFLGSQDSRFSHLIAHSVS